MSLQLLYSRFRKRLTDRVLHTQALKFAGIGVLNTLLDLAIFLTALKFLTASLVIANVLAWIVAVSFSYVLNSMITFAAYSGRRVCWRDYAAFVTSGLAGVTANTVTLVVAAQFVPVLAAKFLAIGVSFVVNFTLARSVVFRPR